MAKGLHHLGLATHDMESTLAFYEEVLGFPAVVCELIELEGGGVIRHAFFDVGNGELLAFMEANDVVGVSDDFDAGINKGLGAGSGMYHFAFKVDDATELMAKRDDLQDVMNALREHAKIEVLMTPPTGSSPRTGAVRAPRRRRRSRAKAVSSVV